MIRTATTFLESRSHLLFVTYPPHIAALRLRSASTTTFRRNKWQSKRKMGASWSASWNSESKQAILWTSIGSPPATKLFDPFQVSVGLSKEATQRLASEGSWQVDFEVDVAHLQKRLELCVSKADDSSEQCLTLRGDLFRKIIEENELSNDELCNICVLHFKLDTGGQTLGEFCLLADISREGMLECDTAELRRKVYGDTKQNVPDRLM